MTAVADVYVCLLVWHLEMFARYDVDEFNAVTTLDIVLCCHLREHNVCVHKSFYLQNTERREELRGG